MGGAVSVQIHGFIRLPSGKAQIRAVDARANLAIMAKRKILLLLGSEPMIEQTDGLFTDRAILAPHQFSLYLSKL
jgi:hypothetical protein